MTDYRFWRCRECGNVVAHEHQPHKCYNCRSSDQQKSPYVPDLYEEVEL